MIDVAQLDQAPDQEVRTLRIMEDQIQVIQRRYPEDHVVHIALSALLAELSRGQVAYMPFLDPRYEVR